MYNVHARWMGRLLTTLSTITFSVATLAQDGQPLAPNTQITLTQTTLSPDVIAVLITAAVAFIAAIITIRSSRDIARRKNAIDAIMAGRRDDKLQEAMKKMREIDANDAISMETYYFANVEDKDGRSLLLYLLNHYENICVGVNNGIFDEEIVKRAEHTIIKNVRTMCLPLIEKARRGENSTTFFRELTELATRWDKKPLERDQAGKIRQAISAIF
ncbi:hypothetical protein GCM10027217_18440 [Pseudomaricurvus hydrocarbonicus]